MEKYAKPGQGFLSSQAHARLEAFLIGQHTLTGIYVVVLVYALSMFLDTGFRSLLIELVASGSLTDTALLFVLILPVASLPYTFIKFMMNRSITRKDVLILAISLALVSCFVGVEYFLHASTTVGGIKALVYVLGLYHLFINTSLLSIMVKQPNYLIERIVTNKFTPFRFLAASLLVLMTVSYFYFFTSNGVASWAYVFTTTVFLWGIFDHLNESFA